MVTAKAGLAGMTKALALDLAPHKITVNCVVPGTIETQRGLPGVPERPAHRLHGAADRPARRAGGDRRHGAHAVRPGRALHHRAVDPRQRRRLHAVKQDSISPVMRRLSALYRRRRRDKALPPAVVEKTKHHVLDTIAAMVSGSRLLPGRKAISYVKTLGGTKEACVIGSRIVTTAVERGARQRHAARTPTRPTIRTRRR